MDEQGNGAEAFEFQLARYAGLSQISRPELLSTDYRLTLQDVSLWLPTPDSGHMQLAERMYCKLLEAEPSDDYTLRLLALVAHQHGKVTEAIAVNAAGAITAELSRSHRIATASGRITPLGLAIPK